MSVYDDNKQAVDPRLLDLLVDGELSKEERRTLLSRLDDVPGAWRQCGLAFLEAQSWKEGLGSITGELTAKGPSAASPAQPRSSRGTRAWTTLLAVAATFLIALGLGLVAGDVLRHGGTSVGETGDVAPPSTPPPEQPRQDAPGGARPRVVPTEIPGPWRMVRVTVPGQRGGEPQTVEIPCLESDRFDDRWFRNQPLTVPAELVRALRDPNVRLRQYRQWVPMRSKDGRQVVLPLEQYEVQYTGNPAY